MTVQEWSFISIVRDLVIKCYLLLEPGQPPQHNKEKLLLPPLPLPLPLSLAPRGLPLISIECRWWSRSCAPAVI